VVAGIGSREGEFTGVRAFGVDDAVVVVEDFVDCYGDGEVGVGCEGVCVGNGLDGGVMAWLGISMGVL